MLHKMSKVLLSAKAKKHYLAYHEACDELSCGKALAEHISATINTHKGKFNEIMDKLAEIDPNCPTTRL